VSDPKRERDIWAVIPAKPLAEAKSRFGLDREQRQAIAQDFLLRVLQVVRGAIPARNAIVVSRDEDILAIARALGLRALQEKAGGDLNDALGAAAVYAQARGAVGVLSVFSDLPYLLPEDQVMPLADPRSATAAGYLLTVRRPIVHPRLEPLGLLPGGARLYRVRP